jgi:hypothetical protein
VVISNDASLTDDETGPNLVSESSLDATYASDHAREQILVACDFGPILRSLWHASAPDEDRRSRDQQDEEIEGSALLVSELDLFASGGETLRSISREL